MNKGFNTFAELVYIIVIGLSALNDPKWEKTIILGAAFLIVHHLRMIEDALREK